MANACGFWGCTPYPFVSEDISPYISDSVQVRFTYDDGDAWAWFTGFDNFEIVFFPLYDVGADEILSPEVRFISFFDTKLSFTATAQFSNHVETSLSFFKISLNSDKFEISTEIDFLFIGPKNSTLTNLTPYLFFFDYYTKRILS